VILDLRQLLLNLDGLPMQEAERATFEKYLDLYMDKTNPERGFGLLAAHDGAHVRIAQSRFEHAFYTKGDCGRNAFDLGRATRVAWIGPIIQGSVPGTECWAVPPKEAHRRPRARNRLYLIRHEPYVVWLEPSQDGGWWFSSAYPAGYGDIRRYCRLGRQTWARKKTP